MGDPAKYAKGIDYYIKAATTRLAGKNVARHSMTDAEIKAEKAKRDAKIQKLFERSQCRSGEAAANSKLVRGTGLQDECS